MVIIDVVYMKIQVLSSECNPTCSDRAYNCEMDFNSSRAESCAQGNSVECHVCVAFLPDSGQRSFSYHRDIDFRWLVVSKQVSI